MKEKMETPDPELIEEYRQRNIRWTTESLRQLSFYNNFLLTLSVGFLSFAFNPKYIGGLKFTVTNIEWSLTLYLFSLITIVLSILIGLILSIYRLQDFRLTRQVNQIRQRMYEHSTVKLDEGTPEKFGIWHRLTLFFRTYPNVTIEECKNYKNLDEKEKGIIKSKFKKLRNIVHNLGLNTWRNTKLQTLCFGLCILMYLTSILIK